MSGRFKNARLREDVPLFPLHMVLFPGMLLPLRVFEPRYLTMMDRILKNREEMGIVLIAEGREVGGPAIPHRVGTLAEVVRMERLQDGTMNVVVAGTHRFWIRDLNRRQPYLQAEVEEFAQPEDESVRAYALSLATRDLWDVYAGLAREVMGMHVATDEVPDHAYDLAFFVATGLQVGILEKQSLLSEPDVEEILAREIGILRRELRLLRMMAETQDAEETSRMGPTGFLTRN